MPKKKQPQQVRETVSLYDAKTHLSALVERAANGEEIVITKSGKPMARLSAIPEKSKRIPGQEKGLWWIAPDFDDPLSEEVLKAFEDSPLFPKE
jgi:prevent-host-death family protein